jgi:hypothetical protein
MVRTSSFASRASRLVRLFCQFLFVLTLGFSGAASALLVNRGANLVYDTVLDITWVRDASLCASLNNCVNRDDSTVSGGMTWDDANTWAANLVYEGFSDWRLPYSSVVAGAGPITSIYLCTGAGDEVACRNNEMGYMFYYNLDGTTGSPKTGNQTALGGEMLTNIQDFHWSGTAFDSLTAYMFNFTSGLQGTVIKDLPLAAWAVRPGDVGAAAVPEPASGVLFGIGALAMLWATRVRRRR